MIEFICDDVNQGIINTIDDIHTGFFRKRPGCPPNNEKNVLLPENKREWSSIRK